MLKTKIIFFLSFIIFLNCKPSWEASKEGLIVGKTNHSLPIKLTELSSNKIKTIDSSVLITILESDGGYRYCSGVLVDAEAPNKNLRVLSSYHCFSPRENKAEMLDKCLKTGVVLTHMEQKDNKTVKKIFRGHCEQPFRADRKKDLAIFTLDKQPPAYYKPIPLFSEKTPFKKRSAYVIHYPDVPKNLYQIQEVVKKIPKPQMTEKNCEVVGEFGRKFWSLSTTLAFSYRHTCDLEKKGSIGSALVDSKTDSLLGINWGGIHKGEGKSAEAFNAATKAEFIKPFLKPN